MGPASPDHPHRETAEPFQDERFQGLTSLNSKKCIILYCCSCLNNKDTTGTSMPVLISRKSHINSIQYKSHCFFPTEIIMDAAVFLLTV